MRCVTHRLTITFAILIGISSAQTQSADTPPAANSDNFSAAMKHIRETWVQEFNAHNAKAVARLYAPDAVLMRWDGTVHGYDSILAEFERSASGNANGYVVHPLREEHSGDLGYEIGAYNVNLRDRVSEGNYLIVVKRIKGEWKIVAHATTSNPRTP